VAYETIRIDYSKLRSLGIPACAGMTGINEATQPVTELVEVPDVLRTPYKCKNKNLANNYKKKESR
jgi:hypothetical protein